MSGGAIELAELVIPAASASEARIVAETMHRTLERLWRADRDAGIGWGETVGTVSLEIDPRLGGNRMGEAIAAEVRARATAAGGGR